MRDKRVAIKAVMDSELNRILNQTGQYENFISGNIQCANCGKTITIDNISTLMPFDNEGTIKLKFYCNSVECVNCEK